MQQSRPPPARVERPTRVQFRGEGGEGQGKFVFAVAANGWHSGCLAVDRGDADGAASNVEEPTISSSIPNLNQQNAEPAIPQHDNTPPIEWQADDGGRAGGGPGFMGPVGGGIRRAALPHFRVGFAGRGRMAPGRGAFSADRAPPDQPNE